MDNRIIKHMLENKISRVYSLIVKLYFEKIETYKASVFKTWLAKELNIDPSIINEGSITAALSRHKKRLKIEMGINSKGNSEAKEIKKEKKGGGDFNTEIPDVFPGFR
jgi:hypothetical protein